MYDPIYCDRGNSVRPYRLTMLALNGPTAITMIPLYDPIDCHYGSSV